MRSDLTEYLQCFLQAWALQIYRSAKAVFDIQVGVYTDKKVRDLRKIVLYGYARPFFVNFSHICADGCSGDREAPESSSRAKLIKDHEDPEAGGFEVELILSEME